MEFDFVHITLEEERRKIFQALESDNTIHTLLHELLDPKVEDFLYATNPKQAVTIGVYHGEHVVAVAFVSPCQNKSGLLHFCFTKAYFPYGVFVGKEVLKIFKSMGFLSLMGITPKPYKHVFELAKKIGFSTHQGELAGMSFMAKKTKYVPAILSTINF